MYKVILTISLFIYLLIPAYAQIDSGTSMTVVGKYKPTESQTNAQKFLSHILEHIQEGTLGGNIPVNTAKIDLQTQFGLKDEELITSKVNRNVSFFDRDGYRYFLMFFNTGSESKEYLYVIGVQFKPLTKEQIFDVFGSKPYADSKMYHQIIYKFGDYSVMFTNTDEKNRDSYNFIMLSPRSPNYK